MKEPGAYFEYRGFFYVICYDPERDMYWGMIFKSRGEFVRSVKLYDRWQGAEVALKAKIDRRLRVEVADDQG